MSAVQRYLRYYSVNRLRRLAERKAGTRHSDLYQGLCLVMEKLGGEDACAELGLYPLGSFLFSKEAISGIGDCSISNRDLLDAIRSSLSSPTIIAVDLWIINTSAPKNWAAFTNPFLNNTLRLTLRQEHSLLRLGEVMNGRPLAVTIPHRALFNVFWILLSIPFSMKPPRK